MSNENRRVFIKSILTGGAAAAVGAVAKAAPVEPPPKVITVTKTVVERVEVDMPKNISGEEMAIWLVITERRRRLKQAAARNGGWFP